MTKDEQAMKLLALADEVNLRLAEPDILQDALGVSNKLSFHLDDKTFAAVARLAKRPGRHEVVASYHNACFHGSLTIGEVEFAVCHNLL